LSDATANDEVAVRPRSFSGGQPGHDDPPTVSRDDGTGSQTVVPLWYKYAVLVGGSLVLFCGGVGLLLADLGHFSAPLALALGSLLTVAGVVLARPHRARSVDRARPRTLPTVAVVIVAGAIAAWNSVFAGHHIAVDTDPGVYAVAGRWLASHSSLVVHAGAPWTHTGLTVNTASVGMYPQGGGTLEFQFAHLWPALLAEAYSVGGASLMFVAPALIGALGLCVIYIVGCRLVCRPWVVVAAVAALGVSIPELAVTRDTFSEPSTQVLLWLAIWLLVRSYEERRIGVALLAGLAVGGTVMTHIDAVVYLAPLPLLGALAWLAGRSRADRRELLPVLAAVLVGIVPPALIGTFDVQRRSGLYYSTLHAHVLALYQALALAVVIAVLVVLVWPRSSSLRRRVSDGRRRLSIVAGWIVGSALLLAWSLRPAGPKAFGTPNVVIGALQGAEGVPVQPGRTYAEQTLRWIDWYIGPVTLALAIAGLCLLTVRVIGRGSARGTVLLAMTAPVTAIYLWAPEISSFQTWATRRYVPAALPLLLLCAVVALDAVAQLCASRLRDSRWAKRSLIAGIAGMVAFSLGASLPVGRFQPQAHNLRLIQTTCATIGPRASVVLPPDDYDTLVLEQSLRSWCNVPAAALGKAPVQPQELQTALAAMHDEGRTLWVLASSPKAITQAVPTAVPHLVAKAVNARDIEATVTRPPSRYATESVSVYGAEITS
jgi:hypothetical protein